MNKAREKYTATSNEQSKRKVVDKRKMEEQEYHHKRK